MGSHPQRVRRASTAIVLAVVSFAGGGTAPDEIVPFSKVSDGATTIAELRARAVTLPELGADDICPVTTYPEPVFEGAGNGVRAGPVGAVGIGVNGVLPFDGRTTDGWHSSKVLWVMDADLAPVIVRGRRLDGPGEVRFRSDRGADADVLTLDQDVASSIGPELRDQPSALRVRAPGCYALQIDGPDFQSVIVFRATTGPSAPTQRSFALRAVDLDEGDAVAFGFHPTRDPITIEASEEGLEVCPAELDALFRGLQEVGPYWFDQCRPLAAGTAVELPAPPVDHIALLVRAQTEVPVKGASVSVTYAPGDEFFHVAFPPLDPGARTPALVVTPMTWDVVAADPSTRGSARAARVVVRQQRKRVHVVDLPDTARPGSARGPVALGEPVTVSMQNTSAQQLRASLAVYWD